jgi:ribosomal protein S18 acetylase RimI-like enzyme
MVDKSRVKWLNKSANTTILFLTYGLLISITQAQETNCHELLTSLLRREPVVTPLTSSDRDQTIQLIQKYFADSNDKEHLKLIRNDIRGSLDDPRYYELMKKWYKNGWIKYYIIKDPKLNKVLGTIGLYKDKNDYKEALWITSLVVSEEARGLGIAQRLIQFAEDYSRQENFRYLRLYTSDEPFMRAAQGFYEKNDYAIKKTHPQTQEDQPTGFKVFLREKKLLE